MLRRACFLPSSSLAHLPRATCTKSFSSSSAHAADVFHSRKLMPSPFFKISKTRGPFLSHPSFTSPFVSALGNLQTRIHGEEAVFIQAQRGFAFKPSATKPPQKKIAQKGKPTSEVTKPPKTKKIRIKQTNGRPKVAFSLELISNFMWLFSNTLLSVVGRSFAIEGERCKACQG